MIRATTGGVMRTYRSNLMNSFINMNKNMNTILSQRTFNSFAEDPAAAARAFRLRKSRMMVESQYEICTDVHKKYETAVACLQSNDDILCTKEGEYGFYMKTLTGTTLTMLNDTSGDAREQLTKALDQMSQQIIQTMNQKYGDNFIFAGADGHNVPFEIRDNKLYYRGVPVDAAMVNVLQNGKDFVRVNENGEIDPAGEYYLKMDNVTAISQEMFESDYTLPDVQTMADVVERSGGPDSDPNVYDEEGNLDATGAGGYYKYTVDGEDYYISIDRYNPDQLIEYNQDGTFYAVLEENPEHRGGYYKFKDGTTDEDGNPALCARSDYKEIEARIDSLVKNANDGSVYAQTVTNEDGSVTTTTYYAIGGKPQKMTPAEYETAVTDHEKLQYLAQETQFVDVGFGFQEDPVTGKLIETSAFDAALNGINFLGYGLDEDGDPRNIYSLVQKMREIAKSVDSGTDWATETYDKFYGLVQKFEDAVSNYQTEFVNLDASTGKLKSQSELLENNFDNLVEQYSNIEDVDMADAITSFLWAQYSYNAALRVGNSVLSQSLMDYLS